MVVVLYRWIRKCEYNINLSLTLPGNDKQKLFKID